MPEVNDEHSSEELSVQRLNIVDSRGRPRLVIASPERFPDPVAGGKRFERQGSTCAGMIFYDDEGDECGGLVFSGEARADSRKAGAALRFDRLEQDQVIGISYEERDHEWASGLTLWDRPELPIAELVAALEAGDGSQGESAQAGAAEGLPCAGKRRMFVGRNSRGEIAVTLADSKGRERIRIGIDAADVPSFEILNEQGEVIYGAPNTRDRA